MDDPSHKRTNQRFAALRLGNNTFPASFFLVLFTAIASWFALPACYFAFGRGWAAPLILALCLFFLMLAFRRLFFSNVYKNKHSDGEAALIEYLVQQNNSGIPGEEEEEKELLENALHLKQVRARECMAPRPEIVYIDVNASLADLKSLFIESSLSRIIVIDGELDQVLGYVHVQQMFEHPQDIRAMVMPITFVPDAILANDLLNKFIRNRRNIACVVDEYGGIAGLVTLEDVLEQLFGDIDDEHDYEEFIEVLVNDHEMLFSGRLEINYLNEKYPKLQLPQGDYNTLSGYIITNAHTIPEQGARLEMDGRMFVLEMVSDRKIETVRIILPVT